jgi:hypothetical protein
MRKSLTILLSLVAIAVLSVALSSCKDDEPTISGISFELEEQEVTESDGTFASFHPDLTDEGEGRIVEVKLVFDHALAGDAVLKFDIDGSARETAVPNQEVNDFEILEDGEMVTVDGDEITILKGATEAIIEILIFEDTRFEYDEDDVNADNVPFENIELTLKSVVSGPAKLGTILEHDLRILEDDAVAFCEWAPQDMTLEVAAVDMDMIIWRDGGAVWDAGAQAGTEFEGFNIPAGLGEGNFGISYTYFKGESDDLDFIGVLFNTAGTLNGQRYTYPVDEPLIYEGNYKKINLNEYNLEGATPPKIAQTMTKSGVNYSDISAITPFPDGGSRIGNRIPLKLEPSLLRKVAVNSSKLNLNILKEKGSLRK